MPDFETIGKYEVLELIGEGGFGVVYKARDPLMERLVAIKVCSAGDEQIRKRFLREAKIAGGLDHPNIVIAFDFGTEDDLPYLVQELLTGEDLRSIIDRQDPLEPDVKLRYLVQIAKGLQHAHQQGVWHRDIKPANVRILDDGRAKLMDFGMAKITNESGTRLTADGSVMGTAGYFAPEQLKALELDQRVDIFSYGVLAYELLTYRKVFPGETFMVVFRQVLHDEPEPLASVWPDCPPDLADLVEKCLCKEREDRFGSFDEILPLLYSVLGSASFDRRSQKREDEEPPEPSATVLKPLSDIASPTVVGAKPPMPEEEERSAEPEEPPTETAEPPVETERPETDRSSGSIDLPDPGATVQTPVYRPEPETPEIPVSPAKPDEPAADSAPIASAIEEDPRPPVPAIPVTRPAPTPSSSAPAVSEPPPAPKPEPERKSKSRSVSVEIPIITLSRKTWMLVGAAVLVVAILGIWWFSGSTEEPSDMAPVAEPVVAPQEPSQAIAADVPTFAVFIEAAPWGMISEITHQTGELVALPETTSTPLVVRLPQGSYQITVSDPRSEETGVCLVDLGSAPADPCRIEFSPLDPLQYFKETGWWE